VLAAACDAMPERASFCSQAAEKQPESADRALAFGKALALSGDTAGAEREFTNAIRLDPSLKRAYLELWTLYDQQHRIDQMRATTERYLNWNPRNILFRRLKAILAMESILSDLPWLVPPH
jgi:Tfp pilus assembly protein PilF